MANKVHYFTEEGLEKMKAELAQLISVERPAISKAIAEARDKGDLSENAEYDAAREAQGLLELKISQMQDVIANARVIDESKINTDHVQLLNKVKIRNLANKAVMEYTIVGESEANIKEGKLAVQTPIGKALIGKKKGEIVEVSVPSGVIKFEIVDISI
jgi:transcription elongation factor GreA